MLAGAASGMADELPSYYHKACDPRAPEYAQATSCTKLHVLVRDTSQSPTIEGIITIDQLWARLFGSCKIELNDGLILEAPGDDSEPTYEYKGQTTALKTGVWSFPSGCAVMVHARKLSKFEEYFTFSPSQVDGADVYWTVDMNDGSISKTE